MVVQRSDAVLLDGESGEYGGCRSGLEVATIGDFDRCDGVVFGGACVCVVFIIVAFVGGGGG